MYPWLFSLSEAQEVYSEKSQRRKKSRTLSRLHKEHWTIQDAVGSGALLFCSVTQIKICFPPLLLCFAIYFVFTFVSLLLLIFCFIIVNFFFFIRIFYSSIARKVAARKVAAAFCDFFSLPRFGCIRQDSELITESDGHFDFGNCLS